MTVPRWTWKEKTGFCSRCKINYGSSDAHLKSVGHKNIPMILRELRNPNVTFTDLANRLGVSRERIRQICKPLDIKGRDRQTDRRDLGVLAEYEKIWRDHKLFREVRNICSKKGIYVELVPYVLGSISNHFYSRRLLLINNKVCKVLPVRYQIREGRRFVHLVARNERESVDFNIKKSEKGYWYIIPTLDVPQNTMFSEDPLPKYGNYLTRHDYIERYKDAWHYLQR